MKEKEDSLEKEPDEVEASSWSGKEFQVMIIRVLKQLRTTNSLMRIISNLMRTVPT